MKNEVSNILSLIEGGNHDKALHEAKLFYNKNENNLDAVKVLAYSYIQVGNFDKVIYLLEKSYNKRKNQQDFDYFNNMGYALSQIEEYDKSISYLKKASKLNDNPSVNLCLAEVFLKKREFKNAKEMILMALNSIKKIGLESYNKYANAFLLISEINGALNKDEETITLFNQILNNKFNENVFVLLANIDPKYIDQKLIVLAESLLTTNKNNYQNKIERFNHVTPLYFGLAMYYQSKDKKKSERYFDEGNKEIFNSTRYNSHQYQERIVKTIDL